MDFRFFDGLFFIKEENRFINKFVIILYIYLVKFLLVFLIFVSKGVL